MNDYTTLLIATGRMDDLLREADRARLAALVKRPAPGRASLWTWIRRFRRPGPVETGSGTARPLATPPTVARPC
jgi:hypothetical protein